MANVAYTRQKGKLPPPPGAKPNVPMSAAGSIKPSKLGVGAKVLGKGAMPNPSVGGSVKPRNVAAGTMRPGGNKKLV